MDLSWPRLLRHFLLGFCTLGFLITLGLSLSSFMEKKTVMVSDVIPQPDGIGLPALTFCNVNGFKSLLERNMTTSLHKYLEHTYSVDELFQFDDENARDRGIKSHMYPTYSRLRGRCYTFDYPYNMSALEAVRFLVRPGVELIMYAHVPGEQFWYSYSYCPVLATSIVFDKEKQFLDVQISKEENVKIKNCKHGWEAHNYMSCIWNLFRGSLTEFRWNCTLPWIRGLMGDYRGDQGGRDCSPEEAVWLDDRVEVFMKWASTYNHTECPRPCKQTLFSLQTESYSYLSVPYDYGSGQRVLNVFYSEASLTINSETLIMPSSALLSAVGGSLGLFLGASLASAAELAVEAISKTVSSKRIGTSEGKRPSG